MRYCRSQRSRYVTGPRGPGTLSTLIPVSGAPVSSNPSVNRVGACQKRGRAAVAVEEALGCVAVLGDDPRREPGRLVVRDPQRLVEPVDEGNRHGRDALRVARPFVADRRVERLRPPSPRTSSSCERKRSRSGSSSSCARPVDEREVEPVADAQPVDARLGERKRLLPRGGRVDVEHAAALGVGERADAVRGREPGQLRRARPAAAQDHERHERGHRDEDARALAIGRAHEPDRGRRQPGPVERRTQHVVDERRDGAQRRAARPQYRRVQALEQLPRDVERDVRPGLEVRADGPDRDPPLVHDETVREGARADLALQRLERGCRLHLRDELVQARIVETSDGRASPRRDCPSQPRRPRRSRSSTSARRSRSIDAAAASASATAPSFSRAAASRAARASCSICSRTATVSPV